ncbi:MAG: ParB N-terminal domain-containing protein [Lentisphaerae bacterium]|jgi:ParB-like chromosome segregation protein Spo0J|nr:ParB N-terminal domain-containing protein [Lentisphaerota bacterium]MBT4818170.1 ParB N-terminal domain-containing protein [Lentisphaerota bacterium]MBT5610507.1 ParB N-terminal domain-containing protein [Lentisphaerota bacterium]MBT7056062.1 ParB N-terminal domain-containing protein [Lentisphaerota bacterium]MBT7842419.1 ParB N-terminal domain-containing protein [Lentisphaerota bacterium]
MPPRRPKALEPHPLSNLLPMMSEDELKKLRADILEVGLKEPIMLFEGKILDGRNRYRACQDLGVEPTFEEFDGTADEALDYVLAKNVQRRQLSGSQRAIVALRFLDQISDEVAQQRVQKIRDTVAAKKEMGELLPSSPKKSLKATDIAGLVVGVSGRYVADAKLVQEKAPELVDQVFSGELPLSRTVKGLKPKPRSKKRNSKRRSEKKQTPLERAIRQALRRAASEPTVAEHLQNALSELQRRLADSAL